MQLDRHIEILLLSNDCVIVPDFGGFMAHHVDARYDEGDGTFVPPLRTLGFNPQLTMNDSLLVQSYVEAYDISYPEALRMIEDEVNELKQHLEAEGFFELNNIGTLSLNEEGHILFAPSEAGILTPSYYGLSTVEMPQITAIADADVKSEPAPKTEKPERDVIIIKMSWLRNAVAVAAAIVAFLMIGTPVSNSSQTPDMSQSSFIPMPTSTRADITLTEFDTKADTLSQDVSSQTVTEDSLEHALDAAIVEEPAVAEEETIQGSEFSIVMASQVSEHNANLFIEQLKANGYYDARIWTNRNKMRRVVYGSYATKADAESTLQQLRSESRLFRNTWIIEIK